jgi:hypothetical protein
MGNFMIRIFIVNFNRVAWPKLMVESINKLPDAEPVIIDNASTFEPCLDWYNSNPCEVVRMDSNYGHLVGWQQEVIHKMATPYYVVSDPDLDLRDVPNDVLSYLKEGLDMYPQIIKAGLSLEIEDLPKTLLGRNARDWERQFWTAHEGRRFWFAPTDTTFAMYRKEDLDHTLSHFLTLGLRSFRPYTAKHWPWYLVRKEDRYFSKDIDMTEEENYYRSKVSTATHWATHSLTDEI